MKINRFSSKRKKYWNGIVSM